MGRARPGLALALAVWAVAAGAQDAPAAPRAPALATAAAADSEREVLAQLRALNAAQLSDEVLVASLFAARLDDLASVEARLAAVLAEVEALESDPALATDPGAALRRELAAQRARYLEALAASLRQMPEAARRILPGISEPRAALREHAERTAALADALEALAERLKRLESRLIAGSLVGFVKEAREVAAELGRSEAALRARAARLRETATTERALAETLEAEARALRRGFLVTLRAPDRALIMDAAFLEHLEAQRRLQRRAGAGASPERREIEALIASAAGLFPERRLGAVTEAAALLDPLGELLARVDALVAAAPRLEDAWRLAFENEVVTVLASQASPVVRREAYALSTTLLRDARAEAALAWERAREGWRGLRGEVPDTGALFTSSRGRAWIARALGLLAVLGGWWLARRSTGALVVGGVRVAARRGGRFGLRLGTLVRGSGLLQAVLPVLFAWLALGLARWILVGGVAEALLTAVAVPFLWYALGLQTLLGATRRITAGRPALIEVSPALLPRLRRTYARLGLVVALAAALSGLARVAIGEGVIATWVTAVALAWVAVWAAWEAVAWRPVLARAWLAAASEPEEGARPGVDRRVAGWMDRSRLGALLSPVAVLRLAAGGLERGLVELSRRTDLAELLEARRLRRAARKTAEQTGREPADLPEEYLREFPLLPILGDEDALLIPREESVAALVEQIARWRESRGEGSVAVVGEKGAGKTTLAALVARRVAHGDAVVVQHTLHGKPRSREDLYRALAPSLPATGAGDFEDWVEGVCAGPDRVVILDEAHNIFLRTVGGYEAYDALVELVNATGKQVFWILLFNSFTWRFLNESHSRQHYFRRLLHVPPWSADEIRDLIRRRHQRTGFDVEFDEMLLSGERASGGSLELVEGADGFFRLLRDSSGGNPRIASRLWLSSLSVVGEKKLRVSTFREPRSQELERLSDELCFALAAICQHENLNGEELRQVLNVPEGLARFAVQYLLEAGLVVNKDGSTDRVTLSAPYYRQTLRLLRNKHLLFE